MNCNYLNIFFFIFNGLKRQFHPIYHRFLSNLHLFVMYHVWPRLGLIDDWVSFRDSQGFMNKKVF